jgi:sulfite dehydrogenase (cytochrome) subunit B
MKHFIIVAVLVPLVIASAEDKVVSIQLPTETAAYKTGPGVELAQGHCVTCHSADYISSQPPMPRKFWEGSVKKMKEKFGAPIPDNIAVLLADYLTATYGVADAAKQ